MVILSTNWSNRLNSSMSTVERRRILLDCSKFSCWNCGRWSWITRFENMQTITWREHLTVAVSCWSTFRKVKIKWQPRPIVLKNEAIFWHWYQFKWPEKFDVIFLFFYFFCPVSWKCNDSDYHKAFQPLNVQPLQFVLNFQSWTLIYRSKSTSSLDSIGQEWHCLCQDKSVVIDRWFSEFLSY